MKLIVMGAGYVGMALLNQLQHHEIYITTTSEEKVEALKPYGKEVIYLPQCQESEFQELIERCDGMVIMVAPNSSRNYEETYLATAQRIASALTSRKAPFYLLYTSSTSVCEGVDAEWITEEMPLAPPSENGKILLQTEECYLQSNKETCILRLGGIYGPKRDLIERARRMSGQELSGTGNEPTNHIHLDDIVSAIVFCIERRLTGVYHLVNEDHRTRRELYSSLCQSLSLPPPLWNGTSKKGGYKVSNEKIKKAGFNFSKVKLEG